MATSLSYPAIVYLNDGLYEAIFLDFKNCYGTGYTLKEVWQSAHQSLKTQLEHGLLVPSPTPLEEIKLPEGTFLLLVEV